jgi:antirestriction protein
MTTNNTATTELDCMAAEQATALTSTKDALQRMQELRREHRSDYQHGDYCAYVGTYGKYNEGNIDGLWVDLSSWTDAEEMLADLAAMHADEADPELMFQDWALECDGLTASDLGECPSMEELQFVIDMANADSDDVELAMDYLQATGDSLDRYDTFSDLLSTAEDLRVGTLDTNSWNPFQDWVEETFLELYGHEIPDNLTGYIDFERMARDWEFEHTVGEKYVFMH